MSAPREAVLAADARERLKILLDRAHVPPRFRHASLKGFHTDANHYEVVTRYVKGLARVRRKGLGLLLYGANGRGKTYAAAVIVREASLAGYTCLFIQAADVKKVVVENAEFETTPYGERITYERRLEEVEFLVLEDVGKEYAAASGFSENYFESLLRRRVQACKPTIITTNLSLEAFRERYDVSITELVRESMYPFEVQGRGRSERIGKAKEIARSFS